ncbi:MAG: aminotransferase class I/II-fold pyridoxal phosphate-dependent enzyme [Phycisphaerales bacterium]|jgi:aspartate/methionine/tyrosine aminotransferase|nr:aminotransferase [Planctomycetaceae bacterium]MDP6157762.1 aminotransferase class I/II-fold pyridoxal phosphate-dependent enzyme [Phycisphaerales bacterium]MDP7086590.1 aminotransferase class I/II-fold pyridoxal phosphate-dependent enzyme [Phycisphaerales bacterium]HCA38789.1 aminotransferase [Phycisphaerales bacterium]HJN79625.1 aminotransferase class I/II-fold pyridoxal phosphate-dependent enzyme [Phycisphaerales bacterium]|tara:strand:+ start:1276 stop:2424 length:1149 start_codon:yes stop_codon:yes gene_type:complete
MQTALRLQPFGESVFATWSRLALEHGAVNLGQGFPDFDGPAEVIEAAYRAMQDGHNQYAPMGGVPKLTNAIAADLLASSGLSVDPASEITVTAGCTEAIAATMLGLLNPGDEVIVFEPFYDSYPATIAMAGGVMKTVTTRPPDFGIDLDAVRAAITPQTRAILLNTPHNPTGHVASRDELEGLAAICMEHDLIAITDEVYDRIVFSGEHVPLATIDGMWPRTITLRSMAKTFSMTGWKIGWAIAPPELTAAVRASHQFQIYSVASPLQHGAAAALGLGDDYYAALGSDYLARRDLLCDALEAAGFGVCRPDGTYFVMCDHTPFGYSDAESFCMHLVKDVGVAAIPPGSFYVNPEDGKQLVRFAFCKTMPVLEEAITRLGQLS